MIVCEYFYKEFFSGGSNKYLSEWASEVDEMAAHGWKVLDCVRQRHVTGFWTVVLVRFAEGVALEEARTGPKNLGRNCDADVTCRSRQSWSHEARLKAHCFSSITSVDLITAETRSPTLSFISSALRFVITLSIRFSPTRTTTCATTSPSSISVTVPARRFLAESVICCSPMHWTQATQIRDMLVFRIEVAHHRIKCGVDPG